MAYGNSGSGPSTLGGPIQTQHAGGSLGAAIHSRPPTPIGEQMQRMDARTGELHAALSELEARMGPVLAITPENDKASPTPPLPGQLGPAVSHFADRVEMAISRIHRLMERLEL